MRSDSRGWGDDQVPIDGGVTISDAARILGISEQTVRRRVRRGELPAIRIERAQGYEYRIQLPLPHRPREAASQTDYPLDQVLAISRSGGAGQPDSQDEEPVLGTLVLEQARQISRLNDERAELYGRLGFLQSENLQLKDQLEGAHIKLQAAQARILELEAPKEGTAESADHSPAKQNGQDSGSQAVSVMPDEQPEAGRRSEVSAPPAANGQEGSSAGAFKRFWHWLTQPI